MALYNNYPVTYPQYYPQNYVQPQQQIPIQQQSAQPQQIQNGGFIPVPSEDVARNYPVAPGNSVTFKNENAPYVYTKTMGFSQLDRPIFEKYKLVREEDAQVQQEIKKEDFDYEGAITEMKNHFQGEIDKVWEELNAIKNRNSKPTVLSKKKEVGGD